MPRFRSAGRLGSLAWSMQPETLFPFPYCDKSEGQRNRLQQSGVHRNQFGPLQVIFPPMPFQDGVTRSDNIAAPIHLGTVCQHQDEPVTEREGAQGCHIGAAGTTARMFEKYIGRKAFSRNWENDRVVGFEEFGAQPIVVLHDFRDD